MTKLVKNLIIGGSATTVLAGGGTGIALALTGKKSSHSNNHAVVAVAKNNQSSKVELERIKKEIETASTPEELKKVETELKEWIIQNPSVTRVIEKEVKELVNEVVTEESKFEISGAEKHAAIKNAKQLISETITEELESKAAAAEKHNVFKEVKETTSNFVTTDLAQKALEAHSKEVSELTHKLFVQAELDRVASLSEGTKELKEGTKLDFANGNTAYETQKAALVDATHAQELLEAQARLDELKRVFALNNGSKYVKDGAHQSNIKSAIEYEANKEITTEANHAKEVAEALAAKQAAQAELDRVASLSEGSKELKEGTKLDFVTSNIEYEIKKQTATDAEYAKVLAETEARHADLVNAFNKREADKDMKQLVSKLVTEEQERIAAQVEQLKRELTKLANDNLAAIEKQTQEARNLYSETIKNEEDRLKEHERMTEQQRQAEIQSKVDEIQKQMSSQISTTLGNHPVLLTQEVINGLKTVNEITSTSRYGTDLVSTLGSQVGNAINNLLTSQKIDGVTFGAKLFVTQEGKLGIKVVATDVQGHELTTSHGNAVQINYKSATRQISASSGMDIKYAIAVAIKANPNKDVLEVIGSIFKDLINSKSTTFEVSNSISDKEANDAVVAAIRAYQTHNPLIPSDLQNRYPYAIYEAVKIINDKINRREITFANDHEREQFQAQLIKVQNTLLSAGY